MIVTPQFKQGQQNVKELTRAKSMWIDATLMINCVQLDHDEPAASVPLAFQHGSTVQDPFCLVLLESSASWYQNTAFDVWLTWQGPITSMIESPRVYDTGGMAWPLLEIALFSPSSPSLGTE
jgi:hypothetical protein